MSNQINKALDGIELSLDIKEGRMNVWTPQPGPQTMAYNSKADVTFFGGAAGGGKSDLAIGLALTQHTNTSIFRRYGTEMRAIIDRVCELIGTRDGLNQQVGLLRLGGQTVEFCSVPHPGDERRFQGRAKDLLVLDEATNMSEAQFRFLSGWVRTVDPSQRCRTLLTFNPPTDSAGRWLLKYISPWIDPKHPHPAQPGELRWFAVIDGVDTEVPNGEPFEHDGETIIPQSRTFIPAKVTDNKYLMATNYVSTLQAMPEPLRSQMLYGDFQVGITDDAFQVIPTAWVQEAMDRWKDLSPKPKMTELGCDIARGGKDKTVIARKHGMWFDKLLSYQGKETPDSHTTAGLIMAAMRDFCDVFTDVIGVGSGPTDILERDFNLPVVGVNVANAATRMDKSGKLKFFNLRSQLWWSVREALDPASNTGIALPPDSELLADLTAPLWSLRGASVFVESRDAIVDRIGRSPDRASAVILCFHTGVSKQKMNEQLAIANAKPKYLNPYDFMDRQNAL